MITLAVLTLIAAANAASTYPGTSTRPILNDTEADTLSEANYLQGWTVPTITIPTTPDFVVGSGANFTDIQAAVNAAILAGGTTRKYINVLPGIYNQTVFVSGSVPITIYGSGTSASDVSIGLNQRAELAVASWIQQVNPSGSRYKQGDPAYNMYRQCASRNNTIGTSCTSIIWTKSNNFQLHNLEVHNTNMDTGDAQAVAIKVESDQVVLSQLRMKSGQDTLYLGSGRRGLIQRAYVTNSYVEGDVDFVFGGASVVFNGSTFFATSARHPTGAIFFAPNTDPANNYGFLVENCIFTGDSTFQSNKLSKLARSWDSGVPVGGYVAGTSPNGQLFIRNSQIDAVVNVNAPYAPSTILRAFNASVAEDRNLQDNNFNRFYEYGNTGDAAFD